MDGLSFGFYLLAPALYCWRSLPESKGATGMADARIKHAANWLARFTVNGVPASDFFDVLNSLDRWEDWCAAWSKRAKIH
jgi:hypothetical protein